MLSVLLGTDLHPPTAPDSHVETLTPTVMVFGAGPQDGNKTGLGHEGGTLVMGFTNE